MANNDLEERKVAALESISWKLTLIAISLASIAGVSIAMWARY